MSKEVLGCGKRSNADRIRNMTNWELAEFIHNVSNGETEISTCEELMARTEKRCRSIYTRLGKRLLKSGQRKDLT